LLLSGLLVAATLLLTGLTALLLLAGVLVGILVLTHFNSFQRSTLPARASRQRMNTIPVPERSRR
jgi:hypothetical protein